MCGWWQPMAEKEKKKEKAVGQLGMAWRGTGRRAGQLQRSTKPEEKRRLSRQKTGAGQLKASTKLLSRIYSKPCLWLTDGLSLKPSKASMRKSSWRRGLSQWWVVMSFWLRINTEQCLKRHGGGGGRA